MNIKLLSFRILLLLSTVSYAYSEKKRQLMSDSEIIASINENISLLLKFERIIFTKRSDQAKKKCNIALKNLKTLNSATENRSIQINPLTSITLNGIIWHSDPCNNPDQMIKHIELYNLIIRSKTFSQISNPNQKNNSEQINMGTLTNKFFSPRNNGLKNAVFRSNTISNTLIKNKTHTKTISQGIRSKMDSLISSGDDNNSSMIDPTFNSTNVLDAGEKINPCSQNKTIDNSYATKKTIREELQELAKMKSVSSKSSTGFSESLSKILSERSAS
ncbi:hypothetical protein [Cryptosporidium parvum Iowa II]|uniref:Uncharacterized protein n=2 Tax=Cryptosporidium parvum TaxID=5807 RepID=Q5CR12_CRYPI|eukprot:QOY42189.1 hypothetical protein CPATCC_001804 [Cryptosporidium parvum]